MGQRETEPVHALGTVGHEAWVVLADAPRIAQHLREKQVPPPVVRLVLAQGRHDVGACRVPPNGVGRHDGIGRPLVNRILQRQRHTACRGFEAVRGANVGHAFVEVAEREAPFGLDRPRRCLVDHVDHALALALSDFGERVLDRYGGSRVAVLVE